MDVIMKPCVHFQLAEEHGVKFMETSAKSGLNVESVSVISIRYLDPTWSVFAYCCQVLYF